MSVYSTPTLYMLSHMLIGAFGVKYNFLVWLVVAYQLVQWVIGGRFFIHTWEIRSGNSLPYTAWKLNQYWFGYRGMKKWGT